MRHWMKIQILIPNNQLLKSGLWLSQITGMMIGKKLFLSDISRLIVYRKYKYVVESIECISSVTQTTLVGVMCTHFPPKLIYLTMSQF